MRVNICKIRLHIKRVLNHGCVIYGWIRLFLDERNLNEMYSS